nr:unnamed protein product [Callosobruchus analis]
MLNEFYRRFSDIEAVDILAESTLLDPRFKRYGFKEEAKYSLAVANLRKKLSAVCPDGIITPQTGNSEQLNEAKVSSKSNLWSYFDENVGNLIQKTNTTAAGVIELDRYISEPLLSRHEDPLSWWQSRKCVYPRLYVYMKKRLCIVATSVPCERTFSKAWLVLNEKRSLLKNKKVGKILFLNANL